VTPLRTFEGALAAEHLVENQAQRMETAANRNLAASQLLGLPKSFVGSSHIGVATIQRVS
jgi:hypothetical protein